MRGKLRWWIIGLVTLGTVLNYLARSTLSVAAPTLKAEFSMSTEDYSWVVLAFQLAYTVMQTVAGTVLDALGTRLGFAVFAVGWALNPKTRFEASGRFTEVRPYGTLATVRVVNTWLSLRAEVLPKQRAYGLGVTAGPLKLFVMSDSANYRRANVLSLRLGFVQAF